MSLLNRNNNHQVSWRLRDSLGLAVRADLMAASDTVALDELAAHVLGQCAEDAAGLSSADVRSSTEND